MGDKPARTAVKFEADHRPEISELPVELVRAAPYRSSRPEGLQEEKLRVVLSTRGQIYPVVVREVGEDGPADGDYFQKHWEIIDGHCVYDALRSSGAKTVRCINLGVVGDEEALMISFELNHTRSKLDHVKASKAIKRLVEENGSAVVAGRIFLTGEQVESYARLVDFDWKAFCGGADGGAVQGSLLSENEPSEDPQAA